MHQATFARALSLITLTLLLLIAVRPTAAATMPTPTSVAPWSARCYTDTCVGFTVTFDDGHIATLGYPSDGSVSWALRESSDLSADETTFTEATVSALQRRDLPSLAVTYPGLPVWYTDALAVYVVPASTDAADHVFLPAMLR